MLTKAKPRTRTRNDIADELRSVAATRRYHELGGRDGAARITQTRIDALLDEWLSAPD